MNTHILTTQKKKLVSPSFWCAREAPGHLTDAEQLAIGEGDPIAMCWCLWCDTVTWSALCGSMMLCEPERCLDVGLVHSNSTTSILWKNHPRILNDRKMWPFLSQEFRVIKIQLANNKVLSLGIHGYKWCMGSWLLTPPQQRTSAVHPSASSADCSDLVPAQLASWDEVLAHHPCGHHCHQQQVEDLLGDSF